MICSEAELAARLRDSSQYQLDYMLPDAARYRLSIEEKARIALALYRAAVVDRRQGGTFSKWLRPWHVVPALREWRPPPGQYGIGIEVEAAFVSPDHAAEVARQVVDWQYVAIDIEGGMPNGMEVTFPPTRMAEALRDDSLPMQYLRILQQARPLLQDPGADPDDGWLDEDDGDDLYDSRDRGSLINASIGTHINVSYTRRNGEQARIYSGAEGYWINNLGQINEHLGDLSGHTCEQLFGRQLPYAFGEDRDNGLIEWKLFRTTTCTNTLKWYIRVATRLSALAFRERATEDRDVSATIRQLLAERPSYFPNGG